MNKKVTVRAMAVAACGVLVAGAIPLSACKTKRDSIVIMAEEFSGLFNPFYATAGADMDVVGQTQLSMLTTDSNGNLVAGDDYATVVKDYEIKDDGAGNSVYTFVLKNGIKFSDDVPLTMNDVMFNIYEYLDPVYTGSSTMYSIKINGLAKYRTQQNLSDSTAGNTQQDQDSMDANQRARSRRDELGQVYTQEKFRQTGFGDSATYYATPAEMRDAIAEWTVSENYKQTVSMDEGDTDYNKKLLADYELVLKTFEDELNSDFRAARESFDTTSAPYNVDWIKEKLESDVFKFFLYEDGYITAEYVKDQAHPNGDRTKIDRFVGEADYKNIIDMENGGDEAKKNAQDAAVKKIFDDKINGEFDSVLTVWGTAGEVLTKFAAEAKEVILNGRRVDGQLLYPRVDGIVSLGHKVNGSYVLGSATSVKVNNTDYNIAYNHNADGTPSDANTYDILRVTLDGKDPKAKYNFSFSVAPVHYYSNLDVNIENNEFGVAYSDAGFQNDVIQSQRNNEVPLGAGPYKASNDGFDDTTTGPEFWRNNYVYYKANKNFLFPVKTEKLMYQYVSSSNALDKLASREIDFVTPQFTQDNSQRLNEMESDGFKKLYAWQLGYGYVGINAGKVQNLNLRKAIMSAMQAELATEYYETGTCEVIDWPMSNRSWAYPTTDGKIGGPSKDNGHDYAKWTSKSAALEKIRKYTSAAAAEGATNLTYKFTIAGASITEHPTYNVFKQAADLLNECGWSVEVKADSQALTKLATGSLEVWAAAWGSTIDPDMYQVYHKNSTASSVYAWGYREILAGSANTYGREQTIITNLSKIIDQARQIDLDSEEDTRAERKPLYETAMGYVLDLAVEMPVYQRQNLYAYDADRIGGINENVNPFTSPLEKIWELYIKD